MRPPSTQPAVTRRSPSSVILPLYCLPSSGLNAVPAQTFSPFGFMSKNTCCPILAGPLRSLSQVIEPQTASPPQAPKRTFDLPSSRAHSAFTSAANAAATVAVRIATLRITARGIVSSLETSDRRLGGAGRPPSRRCLEHLRPHRLIAASERCDGRRRRQDVHLELRLERQRRAVSP